MVNNNLPPFFSFSAPNVDVPTSISTAPVTLPTPTSTPKQEQSPYHDAIVKSIQGVGDAFNPQVQEYRPIQIPQQPLPAIPGAIASDENLKTDIKDVAPQEQQKLMDQISTPKSFTYKDEQLGGHMPSGMMAQDLEKTQMGKAAVINTPGGKMVDIAKLGSMLLPLIASKLQQHEDSLQGLLDSKFKKGSK
jgi:hypothetical protein